MPPNTLLLIPRINDLATLRTVDTSLFALESLLPSLLVVVVVDLEGDVVIVLRSDVLVCDLPLTSPLFVRLSSNELRILTLRSIHADVPLFGFFSMSSIKDGLAYFFTSSISISVFSLATTLSHLLSQHIQAYIIRYMYEREVVAV